MDNTTQPSNNPNGDFRINTLPKWAKLLLTIGGAVVVLVIAIDIGSTYYYQVNPLSTSDTQAPNPDTLGNMQAPENTATFEQAFSSATVSGECKGFSADDPSLSLSAAALLREGQKLCDLFVEKGVSVIRYPLAAGQPSVYYGGDGAYNVVGIIESDRTYLVSFSLFVNQETGQYQMILNHASILKTIKVSSVTAIPIQSSQEGSQLIKITGINASGSASEEYFGQYYAKYFDGSFSVPVTKNSDGSFSNVVLGVYNSTKSTKVSFLVPYTPRVGQMVSDRDYQIELQNHVSPIYHKAACGLEESYGDVAFYIDSAGTSIDINFGYSPILYITTANQGYIPEQWGKILKEVAIDDFRAIIQEPKATRSSAKVEMLTINGYSVKHTGPITPAEERTCLHPYTYDMYQTIKNGAVITLTVRHESDLQENIPEEIQKLMSQLLTTLTFSPR